MALKILTEDEIADQLYRGVYNVEPRSERAAKAIADAFGNAEKAKEFARMEYPVIALSDIAAQTNTEGDIYLVNETTPEYLADALGHEDVHATIYGMKKRKASNRLDELPTYVTLPSRIQSEEFELPRVRPTIRHDILQRMPIEEAMHVYKLEGSY